MPVGIEYPVHIPCHNCDLEKCSICIAANLFKEGFVSKPENHCSCYASNPNGHLEKCKALPRKSLITKQEGSSAEAIIEKPVIEVED